MRASLLIAACLAVSWHAAVPGAQRGRGVVIVEGESLVGAAKSTAGPVLRQEMQGFGPDWSGNAQLFWRAPAPAQTPIPSLPHLTFLVTAPQPGQYQLTLRHTVAPDYGNVRVFVGGQPVADYVGYAPAVGVRSTSLGTRSLPAGPTQFVLTVTGRHPSSGGHFAGIDRIELRPPGAGSPTTSGGRGLGDVARAPAGPQPPRRPSASSAEGAAPPHAVAPGTPLLPAVDPGPLGRGQAIGSLNGVAPGAYPACSGSGIPAAAKEVLNLLAKVAPLFGGEFQPPDTRCGSYKREIAAGVTLGPPQPAAGTTPQWPLLGGRGDLMADAMLCLLKDIGDRPQGRVENHAPVPIGIGKVEMRQTVGLSKFDPKAKRADLYHVMRICAPLLGCLDAGRQNITATVRQSVPAWPAKMKSGDYPIAGSYSVEVEADWMTTSFGAKLPPITIVTPYGQVTAQPGFTYGANLLPADVPFSNTKGVSVEFHYPELTSVRTPLVDDTHGRAGVPFLLHVRSLASPHSQPPVVTTGGISIPPPPAAPSVNGWSSQLGLGGRDGAWDAVVWKPSEPKGPFRPDLDFGTARSALERRPAANFVAEAPIRFEPPNPKALLPSAIADIADAVELWIEVNPKFAADYAAQFALLSREAVLEPPCRPFSGEIGPPCGMTEAAVGLQANAQGRAEIVGTVHLSIVLPWPLDDINVHKPFSIPIASPPRAWSPSRIGGVESAHESSRVAWAARAATAPDTSIWQGVRGLSGAKAGDVESWRNACLATPPKNAAPPPPPKHDPGNADDLRPDLLPCNICVADSRQSQYDPALIFAVKNRKAGLAASICEWEKNAGCYDLCSYKGVGWVQVEQAAVDIVGPECGQHKPPVVH